MFTRLAIALGIASIGDQVFLVALPWLVLQLTGSGLALGGVLTLAALPRAGLILVGGAISDRYDTRFVLMATYGARALLLVLIAVLVTSGLAQSWHLYPFAVAFGAVDAFSQPAASGLTPRIVAPARLASANSVIMATSQTCAALTSVPAGALIAAWGTGATLGIGALASTAAGVVLLTLGNPALGHGPRASTTGSGPRVEADAPGDDPRTPIPDGAWPVIRAAWRDPGLRAFLVVIAGLSLATLGPLAVGLPAMAQRQFGGSLGLGVLMTASAIGSLSGTLLAGRFGRVGRRGLKLLAVNVLVAGCLLALASAQTLTQAAVVVAVMALASGFLGVVSSTSLQVGVDRAVLGRVMSLVMLASVGLAPFSFLLAGLLLDASPGLLFPLASALVVAVTVYAAGRRALRTVD